MIEQHKPNPNKPLRILHIIAGLGQGGAESVLFKICLDKQATDFQHVVVSLTDTGYYGKSLEQRGVVVHCVNMRRGRIAIGGFVRLYRIIRAVRPDVVQTWMYHADLIGGVLARLSGIRSVVWCLRSNVNATENRLSTFLVVKICSWLSRWVPIQIISCSEQTAIEHQAFGYASGKFTIIPNGFSFDQLRIDPLLRKTVRERLSLPPTIPIVGLVARYNPQKDHGNLIRALELLQRRGVSFLCLLVGDNIDEQNTALVAQIHAANLVDNVCLLGPRNDIVTIMHALDVFVLSSRGEAFPNVLAEAMACGTPCVTTDVGDAALIVGNTGWVVPRNNPLALADAIETAMNTKKADSLIWQQRQQHCHQRIVDFFSLERMLEGYKKVWLKVLNNNTHKV